MRISTTITAEKDGITLFETDVDCDIVYSKDRYGELEWHVDQYVATENRKVWDEMGQKWVQREFTTSVPENLAEVFDEHLDRKWMEEQILEQLMGMDADRGDYLRDLAMDR
jgi:hypothetical protein